MKIFQLTNDWKEWLTTNLSRGCAHEDLVRDMTKNNFDPDYASSVVKQLSLELTNPQQNPESGAYVYELPRFQWVGNVINTADKDVRILFRLDKPVVALLDGLLSEEECDELVRLSSLKLKRSTTVDPLTGQEMVIEDRTSYGTHFTINENDFIAKLDARIAKVMNWPIEKGEGIQVLNYKVGAEYKPHYDYFDPKQTGSARHLSNGGQRVSTLIMYLNNVEDAGETIFPEVGLSIVPKKGTAIYFEYCNSLSQIDSATLHGGTPVKAGDKWIATKWMRQNRFF